MSERLKRQLWPDGKRTDLFVLLDCARKEDSHDALTHSSQPFSCLFAGKLPEKVEKAAPHLVQLCAEDKFIPYLIDNWGNSLGVYVKCAQPITELRRHLRRFLTVQGPKGQKMLFRYYDPRVLRSYLPTCEPAELKTVFGPIDAFMLEARDSSTMLEFRFDGKKLLKKDIPVGLAATVRTSPA